MAAYKYANNATTTLAGGVTGVATTISVASASLFPTTPQFTIEVDSEIMLVTAVAGTTWTVTRGAEGSAAVTHSGGATVALVLTKASLLNSRVFDPRAYGELGSADDSATLQAAIDAAVAAGGGQVFIPQGTWNYNTGLTLDADSVQIVGTGPMSRLNYGGTGVAVTIGTKTSLVHRDGVALRDLRITGTSSAAGGVLILGAEFSDFYNLRIDGFSGASAYGLKLDTQSASPYQATIHDTFSAIWISGCTNGIVITKDAADPGTDGCNHNAFYGVKITDFTGIGIDNDAGEFNSFFGCDASTGSDGTTGIRINDDVCSFFGVRTDNSFVGNTAIGIRITANGRSHIIIEPTGNGPATAIQRDDLTVYGTVIRQGFSAWVGDMRRSFSHTGADYAITRAWKNITASNLTAGEIGYFDSTCAEGECKRHSAGSNPNPMVCVAQANASGGIGQFAERGSVVTVNVDTGAVNIGDTLVTSTTVNGRAMANNAVTDPRFIVGTARTSKSAGSNGTVKALIR